MILHRILVVVFVLSLSLGLVVGCSDDEDDGTVAGPTEDVLLYEQTNVTLHEDDFTSSHQLALSHAGALRFEIELLAWPGDYGLELLLMDESNYDHFSRSETSTVLYNRSVYYPGSRQFRTPQPMDTDTLYRVIVDNTGDGFEDTDFDGEDDIARYNLRVYLEGN